MFISRLSVSALLLLAAGPVAAQSLADPATQKALAARFDAIAAEPGCAGVALRIATLNTSGRAQVVFERYSKRGEGPRTRYATASSIKWVSAATMLAARDRSKTERWARPIDLDAPLRDVLRAFTDPYVDQKRKGSITLRHMFSHTSNLPGEDQPDMRAERLQDWVTRVATGRSGLANPPRDPAVRLLTYADFPDYRGPRAKTNTTPRPGTIFAYGSASIQAGGGVIERLYQINTGTTDDWHAIFARHLAWPLNLENPPDNPIYPRRGPNRTGQLAGGGLTSLRDYNRLQLMLANDGVYGRTRVLSKDAVMELTRPTTEGVSVLGRGSSNLMPDPAKPTQRIAEYGLGMWLQDQNRKGKPRILFHHGASGFKNVIWVPERVALAGKVDLTRKATRLQERRIEQLMSELIADVQRQVRK